VNTSPIAIRVQLWLKKGSNTPEGTGECRIYAGFGGFRKPPYVKNLE
jgi:hypothetical protein